MGTSSQHADASATATGRSVVTCDATGGQSESCAAIIDLLSACSPAPKLTTMAQLQNARSPADQVAMVFCSASMAAREAILQGANLNTALSAWAQQAEAIQQICAEHGDKIALVMPPQPDAIKVITQLGLTPSGEVAPQLGMGLDTPDPIIDDMAELAIRRRADLPSIINGSDVLGLTEATASEDRAAALYFDLTSRVMDLEAERESLTHQIMYGQDILARAWEDLERAVSATEPASAEAFQTFREAMSVGRSKGRLDPLRLAMLHKPTKANYGPLTPQRIIAPSLTRNQKAGSKAAPTKTAPGSELKKEV